MYNLNAIWQSFHLPCFEFVSLLASSPQSDTSLRSRVLVVHVYLLSFKHHLSLSESTIKRYVKPLVKQDVQTGNCSGCSTVREFRTTTTAATFLPHLHKGNGKHSASTQTSFREHLAVYKWQKTIPVKNNLIFSISLTPEAMYVLQLFPVSRRKCSLFLWDSFTAW